MAAAAALPVAVSGYLALDAPPPPPLPPSGISARAVLDCEGDVPFWPEFRRALKEEGPMGERVGKLASAKWLEWQEYVDDLQVGGISHDGSMQFSFGPDESYSLRETMDFLVVIQRAHQGSLTGLDPPWDAETLAGFAACPVGFLFVQYVVYLSVQLKLPQDSAERQRSWEGMFATFKMVLGLPGYVFDNLESANWGVTSFDIAVNMGLKADEFIPSYEAHCVRFPVPRPQVPSWREEVPEKMLGHASTTPLQGATEIRIAIVGLHGPGNLDHISTLLAALRPAAAAAAFSSSSSGSVGSDGSDGAGAGARDEESRGVTFTVEVFFSYLFHMNGTFHGEALRAMRRTTWEEFWGAPLTATAGRSSSKHPGWTVAGAVRELRAWAAKVPMFSRGAGAASLIVCSEPTWMCALLHAALGEGRGLLVRVVMCLLVDFGNVFVESEVNALWPVVRAMGHDLLARGGMTATNPYTAEITDFQTGLRMPCVPALGLHAAAAASYAPRSSDVLFFRVSFPARANFLQVLKLLSEEMSDPPRIAHMDRPISFEDMAGHRAVIILPHVPNAFRLADVYAMALPALVPGEPLIHKFMWPYAGPYGGRSASDLVRSVDPEAQNRSKHPFSPFDFQGETLRFDLYHQDRRYWAQFTDWEQRPGLVRFRSAVELLERARMSETEAWSISEKVRRWHRAFVSEALPYWRAAATMACARGR